MVAGIEAVEAAAGAGVRQRYYALAEEIVAATGLEDLSRGLDPDVLAAILNTLPVELSFVDAQDTVRYFSHENQDKIFPRTRSAIGMKVQNCHPPKSLHMVEAILADFKAGPPRGRGVLDRLRREEDPHPLLPGAQREGRLPRLPGGGAGRHGDPRARGPEAAARRLRGRRDVQLFAAQTRRLCRQALRTRSAVALSEVGAASYTRPAKSSVACTSALRMPGSLMLCPASGTITSCDAGQRLCSAQALAAGQTTS